MPRRRPAPHPAARRIVIDTNCVLDLWLFDDPAAQPLAAALRGGALRWIAHAGMRAELARVLAYPALVRQLAQRGRSAAAVLAAFDRWAQPVPVAAPAPLRCRDPDDQMFVDLAVAWRAVLASRDRALLELRRPLARLGVALHADPQGAPCALPAAPAPTLEAGSD